MTKEQVAEYADQITYTNTRTKITYKNGDVLIGYFDNNIDQNIKNTNHWNFIETPNFNQKQHITLKGDDFENITIFNV